LECLEQPPSTARSSAPRAVAVKHEGRVVRELARQAGACKIERLRRQVDGSLDVMALRQGFREASRAAKHAPQSQPDGHQCTAHWDWAALAAWPLRPDRRARCARCPQARGNLSMSLPYGPITRERARAAWLMLVAAQIALNLTNLKFGHFRPTTRLQA
jgi:hypothetical protein